MSKTVYSFGGGTAEGDATQRNLLGGKGANLAEMSGIGIPVPAGFTITTEVCTEYNKVGREATVAMIKAEVEAAVGQVLAYPEMRPLCGNQKADSL